MRRSISLVWLGLSMLSCSSTEISPSLEAGTLVTNASEASTCKVIPWMTPRAAEATCNVDEIQGYYDDCIKENTALPIRCQQFVVAHARCSACITARSNTKNGALIVTNGSVEPNVGGCIALLLNDTRPDGCGAREHAARACRTAQCASCVELQLNACVELNGAATCTTGRTPEDTFRNVARVFCGI